MDGQDHRENHRKAGLHPPWQPGRSGNPGGRPKGQTLTSRLRKIIDQETKDGKDYGDLVMQVLVKAALKGDMKAMSLLLDRVDGKVIQQIQFPDVKSMTEDELVAIVDGKGSR